MNVSIVSRDEIKIKSLTRKRKNRQIIDLFIYGRKTIEKENFYKLSLFNIQEVCCSLARLLLL